MTTQTKRRPKWVRDVDLLMMRGSVRLLSLEEGSREHTEMVELIQDAENTLRKHGYDPAEGNALGNFFTALELEGGRVLSEDLAL